MVTNVGVFGIEMAWAPLIPYARTPLCITLGAIRTAPSVVGDAIVPRKRVSIGVVFDHRVMDGYHAGVMARRFEEIFADPDVALGDPRRWTAAPGGANAQVGTSAGDAPP